MFDIEALISLMAIVYLLGAIVLPIIARSMRGRTILHAPDVPGAPDMPTAPEIPGASEVPGALIDGSRNEGRGQDESLQMREPPGKPRDIGEELDWGETAGAFDIVGISMEDELPWELPWEESGELSPARVPAGDASVARDGNVARYTGDFCTIFTPDRMPWAVVMQEVLGFPRGRRPRRTGLYKIGI